MVQTPTTPEETTVSAPVLDFGDFGLTPKDKLPKLAELDGQTVTVTNVAKSDKGVYTVSILAKGQGETGSKDYLLPAKVGLPLLPMWTDKGKPAFTAKVVAGERGARFEATK